MQLFFTFCVSLSEGQSDPPRPAESINGEQISSDAPVENEDNMAPAGSDDVPAAEAELSSDQTSSGWEAFLWLLVH